MLKRMIDEKLIQAKGIIGFYPCNSNDEDDIEVYDEKNEIKAKFHGLRQ
jgi:5-methyltetrahydrofolate--homocysteine methyltransferase